MPSSNSKTKSQEEQKAKEEILDVSSMIGKIEEKPITDTSQNHVGYFRHHRIDEKHMGAILITNRIGVPLEFKYTEPVVATKLHKILYGSVLEKYLHETVIRDRLGSEIREAPDYFITSYDMIGKSGVWGHFGSWDFVKATM